MPFFADYSEQSTLGTRGKTTKSRRTKTVRGPEGAWIAQMKEELAAKGLLPAKKYTTRAQRLAAREAERARLVAMRARQIYQIVIEEVEYGRTQLSSGGEYETLEQVAEYLQYLTMGPVRGRKGVVRTQVWIRRK